MIIGIPREILVNERRVAALPETVAEYIKMGFEVLVEASAGEGALRPDREYEAAGARIASDIEDFFSNLDLVLKVKEPCYNSRLGKHEAEMLREGVILIGFLHPAAPSNHEMVRMLRDGNVTAFSMDSIPRISRAQKMDALTTMSTIAGYKSVLMAASHFPRVVPMVGTAVGTIKPARFLVIGVGVVGLQAIATAKRLGGMVTALDICTDARDAAASLGAKVPPFDVPQNLAVSKEGHACALPEEWLVGERSVLAPLIAESDIVILSALVPGEEAPLLVTEDMIASMKPGSVVVDVAVDQGGNCELTRPGEEVTRHGVLVSGVQNLPGAVPVDASWLYSRNLLEYVRMLFKNGVEKIDMTDDIVQSSLVTCDGRIVHQGTLKAMSKRAERS